jgi:type II secretory pathway pseudopilin PulG
MLVVISIIGVIAAIGVGLYGTVAQRGDAAKTRADMEVIMAAIYAYKDEKGGELPDTLGELSSSEDALQRLSRLDREVFKRSGGVKLTDRFGHSYEYSRDGGRGGSVLLLSVGPDGKKGTEGDIRADEL